MTVEQADLDCLIAATRPIGRRGGQRRHAGRLTDAPHGGRTVPGQSPAGLRAVLGGDRGDVAAAAAADVGANLLVVDPRGGHVVSVKQMLIEFCRGGVRPCPAAIARNG